MTAIHFYRNLAEILITAEKPNNGPSADAPKEDGFWKWSMGRKLRYIREVVTVEPLITSYVFAAYLCIPAIASMEFEKACRVDAGYNDTVCDYILAAQVANLTEQNHQVQLLITNMHSWQTPMQSIVPILLILFLGSYSDRHKIRKPFLILPLIGELFAVVGVILCCIYMREWGLNILGVLATVIPSFFGGQSMLTMATFAYIADVSTLDMRTIRIGIVQITLTIASPIAQYFSAFLLARLDYIPVFSIGLLFYIFGILYGFFWIKEPQQPEPFKKEMLLDVFNPKHCIDTINLLFKKSVENNRVLIVLVMAIYLVNAGVLSGEVSLFILYTQGKFNWTPIDTTYFLTVATITGIIGVSIAIPLFTKYFKLSDFIIIIIAFMDKVVADIIYSTSQVSTYLFIAMVVGMISGTANIGMRSVATKVVSENDLGKAQSIFGVCEAVAPAVFIPIYNKLIYNNTIDTFPGAFFLVGSCLYILCCILITSIVIIQKRSTPSTKLNGDTNNKKAESKPPLDDNITHSTYL